MQDREVQSLGEEYPSQINRHVPIFEAQDPMEEINFGTPQNP